MKMIIENTLTQLSLMYGENIFARTERETLSFNDLNRLTEIVAEALREMPSGLAIGLMLKNSIEYLICYFSIIRAGHIVVPLNPSNRGEILIRTINDIGISAVFADKFSRENLIEIGFGASPSQAWFKVDYGNKGEGLSQRVGKLALAIRECRMESPAGNQITQKLVNESIVQVMHTSGTSGSPKGVCLSIDNLIANASQITARLPVEECDNMIVIIPMYYSYGNSLIWTHLLKGASLSIPENRLFGNSILTQIEKWQCTGIAGVASSYIMMLKRSSFRKIILPSLKIATFAGEKTPEWLIEELRITWDKVNFYVMYGQTEATARISILAPKEMDIKKGSVGKPLTGIELNIVDGDRNKLGPYETGEISLAGPNIAKFHLARNKISNPVLERIDILYTGDVGYLDEEGYLYVKGRKDDMVKVGGERISLTEIESMIHSNPDIEDAAVIALPRRQGFGSGLSDYLGTVLTALIVPKNGITSQEVKSYCYKNLPRHKVPHDISFVSSIPRNLSNKISRSELTKLAQYTKMENLNEKDNQKVSELS